MTGHFDTISGVGEAARRLHTLLYAAGLDVFIEKPLGPKAHKKDGNQFAPKKPKNTQNIICLNPDQIGKYFAANPNLLFGDGKNVGFWAWELPELPRSHLSSGNILDEIWSVSSFTSKVFSNYWNGKSFHIQLPVPIPKRNAIYPSDHFSLPTKSFTVLTSFDYFSDVDRKNPAATIRAFCMAFPKPGEAILVVKSINGHVFQEDKNTIMELAKNREDIYFIDDYLTKFENDSLLDLADVFVSLHRSEGYGINMIDAMARGKPVVATGYSGNLDYMDDTNAVLVPFSLVRVRKYAGFNVESEWAEPDVGFAAQQLKQLHCDSINLKIIGNAALNAITEKFSLAPSVKRFQKEFGNAITGKS